MGPSAEEWAYPECADPSEMPLNVSITKIFIFILMTINPSLKMFGNFS